MQKEARVCAFASFCINRTINSFRKSGRFLKIQMFLMVTLYWVRILFENFKDNQAQGRFYNNLLRNKDVTLLKIINPLDYPTCFDRPLRLDGISAWVEHTPFAMFLIEAFRPKVFVELGSHTGVFLSVPFPGNYEWLGYPGLCSGYLGGRQHAGSAIPCAF